MFTLIELLVVISIGLTISLGSLQVFFKCFHTLEARMTLKKLAYTLALARSHALVSKQAVQICPANPNTSNWTTGWTIQSQATPEDYFFVIKTIFNHTNSTLKFNNYPNSSCLHIDIHGMTQNNGNFNYQADGLLYTVEAMLCTNKGLTTYIVYGENKKCTFDD
jgi:type II secretory pathway pseudopilin PulG